MTTAVCIGCGPDESIDAGALADAQAAYDSAIDELDQKNTEAALELLDQALVPGGGLPADIVVDARIQRAICLARVERFEDAHADLDHAAEGAGDMSAVHAARAYVFSKEGNQAKSKAEMKQARSLNRRVKKIVDIR